MLPNFAIPPSGLTPMMQASTTNVNGAANMANASLLDSEDSWKTCNGMAGGGQLSGETAEGACQISVIIPTYSEAVNLGTLVPRLSNALSKSSLSAEILIIDDNSQDGTQLLCKELAATYPIRLIVRTTERGLASAVMRGLSEARGHILVVMDADLSHPPEKVPELFYLLQNDDTDFVIGSRYVLGGKTDEKWGILRRLNSKVATLLAWPLTVASDPMAGFFALRKSTYDSAAERLNPIGYKIGLELIVKCECKGIKETPIQFADRTRGTSKLNLTEQINYLRHLWRLYKYRFRCVSQLVQFLVVGGTGTIVDLLIFTSLLLILPGTTARALAIWTAMSWNFGLNRRFTFEGSCHKPVAIQYCLFCLACLIGDLLNWMISVFLYENSDFFATRPLLAALLGIVSGTAFNYFLSKHVAFK